MTRTYHREQSTFWRDAAFNNLELLHATYVTHTFAPHIHESYAIGVIEHGVETFRYRGSTRIAPQGHVVLVNPGEMHTGSSATDDGWTYRMFYPDVALLRQAAASIMGRPVDIPFFPEPVVYDPLIATSLLHLHSTLATPTTTTLERESRFVWTLAHLVMRHADTHPGSPPLTQENASIQRVRAYLEEHHTENVSLEQLARLVNLSPFHLLRVFRETVGLPPHSYLTNVRVARARHLIAAARPLAEVASAVGFTDQSHLTRHFKALLGVTPGQYARASILG